MSPKRSFLVVELEWNRMLHGAASTRQRNPT
jgi:hypothetical protein